MPRPTEAIVTISERKLEALMRKVVRQAVHEEFEKLVK